MNSNPKIEKTEITVGKHLLQEREKLGLSREMVAEQLCLKVSTVREIEDDSKTNTIDPTFLRGYIRSYAKLVKIPEKDILELLDKNFSELDKSAVISPMRSYSLCNTRKKQEDWLMKFTWIIIMICIAMIGIGWWQGYQVHKQEIDAMAKENRLNSDHISEDLAASFHKKEAARQNNINKSSVETDMWLNTLVVTNNPISNRQQAASFSAKLKKYLYKY
ncbi:MAG: helix-turn-helix domain-containing protein [Candidatus Arsenophonus melophagi]|nr:helix-turn-helix domain-containing protein [Candidatus Arsenophonus melophagi]